MKKGFFSNIQVLLILLLLGASNFVRSQEKDPKATITVGIYQNPPKIFIDEKGNPEGIFIDLLEVIAAKENLSLEYTSGEWKELMKMLSRGDIDLMPDVAFSTERDSLYKLNSLPVLGSWLEVFTTETNIVNSIQDLQGKKVGVLKGSIQEEYLTKNIKPRLNLQFNLKLFTDYQGSVEALQKGKIDMIVADRFFYFSNLNQEKIIPSGVIFRPSDLHLAFSNNTDPSLIKLFDKSLVELKNNPNSQYYKILHFWFGKDLKSAVPPYIYWLLIITGVILITVIVFSIVLRYKVKVQTRTLWKRNRQLTRAKEKAEENERLKTIFLQNMSHEIRTPMNGIIGFLELLKEPNLDDNSRKKYIEIVIKSGKRLLSTINNIIEISKIDSDQITVHHSKVNIPEVMEFYHNFFEPQALEKKIELKLSQNLPDDHKLILTDKFIFDNILTNLISNAIKFTHKGYVELGNRLENNKIIFYVKDTGTGIPKERQNAIFDRFVQANLNITRPHEGSGLGLAIVKAYVKALNGQIWIESETGKGSTFYFSIPYIKAELEEHENESEDNLLQVTKKELNIVIAEDDNISFLFINQILNRPEIKVMRTKTGKECVDLLKANPNVDLILMDIKMPEMNGIEATKVIREFNKTVPIIVQTAYTSSRDKELAMEAGCNDFITKPIDKNRLLKLIRKYT